MSSSTGTTTTATEAPKKKKNLAIHLMAGGIAGCCEALACHPLDTIKVRLQLRGERASALKAATASSSSSSASSALKNSPASQTAQALKKAALTKKVLTCLSRVDQSPLFS
jgi:hypothetical protein